jgi:transposase
MVERTEGSHHKEGTTKMRKHSIVCAGIDTGKRKLDVALSTRAAELQVDNTPEDYGRLLGWLRQHRVKRVGIEASGGYEQDVVGELRRNGLVVIVLQPAQVRAYARFHLRLAKNDKIDAALIADCTAAVKKIHAPPDPRLAPFAEQLTLIDQVKDVAAGFKNRLETCRDARLRGIWKGEIARYNKLARSELKALVAAIRQHHDLAQRLDLIASVDGVGLPTAVAILVRMPEIGRLTREQAASLAGLAPFDDDSGERVGVRHIAGGRKRLRGSLYAAALPASQRWNRQLIVLYRRLTAAGRPHKYALVACARKLLIFVNAVVERGTPWVSAASPSCVFRVAA